MKIFAPDHLLGGTIFAGFAVLAGSVIGAEDKAKTDAQSTPDTTWLNDVTRVPPGENSALEPVYVEYGLSWNNVLNAGKLSVGVIKSEAAEDSPASYLGGAEGKSSGMARVLWPYDFECASVVRQDTLRPVAFNMTEKERNRTLDYHILFEAKKLVCSTTKPKEDGSEESVTHLLTYKHDFGQDLLSSILYLRSLPLKDGDEIDMVVTPFNRPYLAQFKVEGRETRKVKGEEYNTIKLSAEIGKINKDLTIQDYDKMKTATIWMTEDEFRLPLEIHADLFVGFVSARMKERKWTKIAPVPASPGEADKPVNPSEKVPEGVTSPPGGEEKPRKPGLLRKLFDR